jgi:hypothetical protein
LEHASTSHPIVHPTKCTRKVKIASAFPLELNETLQRHLKLFCPSQTRMPQLHSLGTIGLALSLKNAKLCHFFCDQWPRSSIADF